MSRVIASVSPFLAAALLVPVMAGGALAQARDPAYAAARAAGQVGEMPTGYLGIVGASTPELKRIVDDINIKRKAVYAERAQAQHATVEEYAFTTGCKLVMQTQPGEKYQTPDGSWQVRGGGAPVRDSRCPA
ncbi:YdbL family protein [Novosphingobium humi]|uniref:YdbL family protein n=1 Tax=Novosphingobium humi TaxID=2282397 RepID=A0ABY7TUW8_9SPHN|nr:YdbL family protein [Novosphingobium humi]WCT76406.1 YdbL family protein [Novosphingobium humi]WJS97144.1 YdbL family protein [Novosphingobium humi]